MIGEIEVVAKIRGDSIRLGIDAPQNVVIHRKEVYLQVQQQNQNAAPSAPDAAQPGSPSTIRKTLDQ